MSFRNMNSKKHIGLQQLSALASSGRTLLGPVKSSKFIVDESTPGGILICSAVRLLENLDLNSAVGQLLNDTIRAQDKEYKSGTTTLLFLVSTWSNAVLECLQQDVPLSVIASVMSEGLNSCIEHVQGLALSLHNTQQRLNDTPTEQEDTASAIVNLSCGTSRKRITEIKTPDLNSDSSILNPHVCSYDCEEKLEDLIQHADTCSSWEKCGSQGIFGTDSAACSSTKSVDTNCVFTACKTVIDKKHRSQNDHLGILNCNQRSKVTHSRYFRSVKEQPSFQKLDQLGTPTKHVDGLSDLEQLAVSLSHGSWPAMKLVQDILRYQLHNVNRMDGTRHLQFNISEVVTCCLPGVSETHSCVYPGYVTSVCPEKAAIAKLYQVRPLRVILLDGDLTKTYHHLGFNRSQNVRILFESASDLETSLTSWVDSVLDVLIQYDVNLVLVQGETCEKLEECCLLNKILVINGVAHNALRAFTAVTGAEQVTYFTQVNEHCVGKGVYVKLCGTSELSEVELNDQILVSLTAKEILLMTVVLCCPVMSKMQATEDTFWTCAYRVHHALHDQAVFPGGGTVEFLCLSYLENLRKTAQTCQGEFNSGSSWLVKSSEQYQSLVLSALVCGWHQYLCAVMCNTATCASEFEASAFIQQHLQNAAACDSPTAYMLDEFNKGRMGVANTECVEMCGKAPKVYDNVSSKTEAWRRALDLVLLVLQTDAEIITGPKKDELLKSQVSNEFLFL